MSLYFVGWGANFLGWGSADVPAEAPSNVIGGKRLRPDADEEHRHIRETWEEIEALKAVRILRPSKTEETGGAVIPVSAPTRITRAPAARPVIHNINELTEHDVLAIFAALADHDD
jgi:hypothetical protein